jgi:hypothetical protein
VDVKTNTTTRHEITQNRIRKLRQAFGVIPDGDVRESRITALIVRLKSRLPVKPAPDYHWMFAAE